VLDLPQLRRELRPTLSLALPIIIGQVSQVLMGLTDSLMIGRIGKVPLAASAFAISIFNLAYIGSLGLLMGVSILVSRSHGAKQSRECAEYLRHGMVLALAVGAGLVLLLGAVATQLHHFGQPAEVMAQVYPFYLIICSSLLPVLVFQVLKQFSEAVGHPRAPMNILLGCVGLNVLLNWIFIWGHCGLPALGLAGSGLATLTSRIVAVIGLWFWLTRRPEVKCEWPEHWRAPLAWARFRDMLAIGIPASGQWLFESGAFSAAAIMMGWLGTVPLAAHQIALACASSAFMFPLGLSIATSMRISKALGAGQRDALRAICFGSLGTAIFGMMGFALLFALASPAIAAGFTHDGEVIALSIKLLIVAAIFQLLDGAQVVSSGALRGIGDVRVPTLITFIAYWVVALPGGWLLAFRLGFGPVGVWSGLAAGLGFAAVMLGWRFHHKTLRSV
jgi:MATE family multidrug resistance protein